MIETIGEGDLPDVATVLSRAFRDNPGLGGILHGDPPDRREHVLFGCMLGFARAVLRHGVVEGARHDGALVAASLVLPPGAFPMPLQGQLTTAASVLRSRPGRAHRFARAEYDLHKQHLPGLHYYLWFLGVEPAHQGRGLGSELLRSLIAKAESAKMPCYLETDRERNVGLYQRHGFEVLGESIIAGMDAQMWFMRRTVHASGR